MANPIIKIKRGNGYPLPHQINTNTGVQLGLTAGELGVNINTGQYSLYVGSNNGAAITFGAEIDSTSLSAVTTPSHFKIPTQKVVKDYIDLKCTSTPVGSTEFLSYVRTSQTSVNAGSIATIPFNTLEFGAITNLSYNATTGVFTNTGVATLSLLVMYQITWDGFTSAQTYNQNIVRSAWIQKGNTPQDQNVYGFSTFLCPPTIITNLNAITGTQNGIGLIRLAQSETFSIQVKNNATAGAANNTTIIANGLIGNGTTTATNFTNATKVQILKI